MIPINLKIVKICTDQDWKSFDFERGITKCDINICCFCLCGRCSARLIGTIKLMKILETFFRSLFSSQDLRKTIGSLPRCWNHWHSVEQQFLWREIPEIVYSPVSGSEIWDPWQILSNHAKSRLTRSLHLGPRPAKIPRPRPPSQLYDYSDYASKKTLVGWGNILWK